METSEQCMKHVHSHLYVIYTISMSFILPEKRCRSGAFIIKGIEHIWQIILLLFCFFIWVFYHEYSRFTEQQGKGKGIFLTPLYHFHPLHRHLNIIDTYT